MKATGIIVLLMVSTSWSAEVESDNKATESKTSTVVSKEEKGKTEKRAPLVMTSVPGELKYTPDIKYTPEIKYNPVALNVINGRQEPKYQDVKQIQYYQPTPAPKPQYIFYSPPPQPQPMQHPMVLMFAVPHPSGQFLMLLPAHNFIQPMFYRPQVQQASHYQPQYTAPQPPALAQSAGFAAQHQLIYPGPYQQQEKYSLPNKQ